jgi:hypothetical protein
VEVTYKESLFSGQSSTKPLEEIVSDIRTGRYKDLVDRIRAEQDKEEKRSLKNKLPAFLVGVLLLDNQPSHSSSKDYKSTGIVQFDIDNYDVVKSRKLLGLINKNSSLLYSFLSPSGGVKFGVLTDFECNDSTTGHKFKILYRMVKDGLGEEVQGGVDDSVHSISQQCFLSYDPDIYFNPSPKRIILNEKVNQSYRKYQEELNRSESIDVSNTTDKEVLDVLSFVPKDLSYDERLSINFSVIDHFGVNSKLVLLSHWSDPDKKKLGRQIDSQIKSHQSRTGKKSTLGTLFYYGKKYGWNRTQVTEPSELKPTFHHDKFYSVSESSKRLEEVIHKDFFNDKKDKVVIVECGSGKTRTMYKVVTDYLSKNLSVKVAVFLKTHEMINQFVKDMNQSITDRGIGLSVLDKQRLSNFQNKPHTIKGRGKLCHMVDVKGSGITKDNIDEIGNSLCDDCFYRQEENCDYFEQFEEGMGIIGNVRIYTHNRLFQKPKADYSFKPDYVIVDEDIVSMMTDTKELLTIRESDYSSIQQVLSSLSSGDTLGESVSNILGELHIDNVKISGKIKSVSKDISSIDKSSLTKNNQLEGYKKLQQKLKVLKKESSLMQQLILISNGTNIQSKSVWVQHREDEEPRLTYGKSKEILDEFEEIPMLYMDGSGEQVVIESVMNRSFEFEYFRVNQQENAKVYQIYNHSFSKRSLDEGKVKSISQWVDLLETKRVGLVRYKKNNGDENYCQELDEKITQINGGGDYIGWFGNVRGINRFEKCDTLLVLGQHRLPDYEIFNLSQMIFRQEIHDDHGQVYLENYQEYLSKESKTKIYRMKGGMNQSVELMEYKTVECCLTSNHFDKAETYQALHRLRLIHGNDNKQVYLFSNTPVDVSVDELIDYHKELGDKHMQVVRHVKDTGFLLDTKSSFIQCFGWSESEVVNFRAKRESGEWMKQHRSLTYWAYKTTDRKSGNVYSWGDKTEEELTRFLSNIGVSVKSISV